MLDGLTLDQLRTFVAAVDEGSFSAAGRKLNRVQSAVSDLVSKLEGQVGVLLFDRAGRYPLLTLEGKALLADARAVLINIDAMRARAKGLSAGIEAELSVVIDAMFPIAPIAAAADALRVQFPATTLRIDVEVLGGAYRPLLDRRASLGIVGPLTLVPPGLTCEPLEGVPIVMVSARNHPLAERSEVISRADLALHVQLVLTDPSPPLSERSEVYVRSPFTWRLADLYAKRAFLLQGLGWGGMPLHAVAADLAEGRLVVLTLEDFPATGLIRPASIAYATAAPPGPAGRWFIERLKFYAKPTERVPPDR